MTKEKNNIEKYYCLERNRWVTEYTILGITFYKLTLHLKKTTWSLRKSKKPMYGPVINKPRMTESKATKLWGPRGNWPRTPYVYIKDKK